MTFSRRSAWSTASVGAVRIFRLRGQGMGNCCCKSGAAGAVAASQLDVYDGPPTGTGRSQLSAGGTLGTSLKGKQGGAVRLSYVQS